ncbi:MAG: hypothetical protein HC880_12720 [Bacteroidia bacterium]|nr:hypothetical protein [Bacteroidia bacterium]
MEVLIETDYDNILDLKDKKFRLSFNSFNQTVRGKLIDKRGTVYSVETISGKLSLGKRIVYVFLFNELEEESSATRERKLKVAS